MTNITEEHYCPLTGLRPTLLRPYRPDPEDDFRPLTLVAILGRQTTDAEAAEAVMIGKATEWVRETDGRVTIWGHETQRSER